MARRKGEEVERCKSVSTLQRMIGGKWKIEILFYIALKDVRHFGQLRRCIGNISESTLSKQLKELAEAKPNLMPHIVSLLRQADTSQYADSMRPLIQNDIRDALLALDSTQ